MSWYFFIHFFTKQLLLVPPFRFFSLFHLFISDSLIRNTHISKKFLSSKKFNLSNYYNWTVWLNVYFKPVGNACWLNETVKWLCGACGTAEFWLTGAASTVESFYSLNQPTSISYRLETNSKSKKCWIIIVIIITIRYNFWQPASTAESFANLNSNILLSIWNSCWSLFVSYQTEFFLEIIGYIVAYDL